MKNKLIKFIPAIALFFVPFVSHGATVVTPTVTGGSCGNYVSLHLVGYNPAHHYSHFWSESYSSTNGLRYSNQTGINVKDFNEFVGNFGQQDWVIDSGNYICGTTYADKANCEAHAVSETQYSTAYSGCYTMTLGTQTGDTGANSADGTPTISVPAPNSSGFETNYFGAQVTSTNGGQAQFMFTIATSSDLSNPISQLYTEILTLDPGLNDILLRKVNYGNGIFYLNVKNVFTGYTSPTVIFEFKGGLPPPSYGTLQLSNVSPTSSQVITSDFGAFTFTAVDSAGPTNVSQFQVHFDHDNRIDTGGYIAYETGNIISTTTKTISVIKNRTLSSGVDYAWYVCAVDSQGNCLARSPTTFFTASTTLTTYTISAPTTINIDYPNKASVNNFSQYLVSTSNADPLKLYDMEADTYAGTVLLYGGNPQLKNIRGDILNAGVAIPFNAGFTSSTPVTVKVTLTDTGVSTGQEILGPRAEIATAQYTFTMIASLSDGTATSTVPVYKVPGSPQGGVDTTTNPAVPTPFGAVFSPGSINPYTLGQTDCSAYPITKNYGFLGASVPFLADTIWDRMGCTIGNLFKPDKQTMTDFSTSMTQIKRVFPFSVWFDTIGSLEDSVNTLASTTDTGNIQMAVLGTNMVFFSSSTLAQVIGTTNKNTIFAFIIALEWILCAYIIIKTVK